MRHQRQDENYGSYMDGIMSGAEMLKIVNIVHKYFPNVALDARCSDGGNARGREAAVTRRAKQDLANLTTNDGGTRSYAMPGEQQQQRT